MSAAEMPPPSERALQHNRDELCDEIARAAYSVAITSGIVQDYAELGYAGGLELALKQMVANVKSAIHHYNMLNDIEKRIAAASQNRSAA